MSNGSGTRMIEEVFEFLNETLFDKIEIKLFQKIVQGITNISYEYDCNTPEIDDIAKKLNLCQWCLKAPKKLIDGLCPSCNKDKD